MVKIIAEGETDESTLGERSEPTVQPTKSARLDRAAELIKELTENIGKWSRSYCLLTTGQTTLDVLKRYVESQGEEGKEDINKCHRCGW